MLTFKLQGSQNEKSGWKCILWNYGWQIPKPKERKLYPVIKVKRVTLTRLTQTDTQEDIS